MRVECESDGEPVVEEIVISNECSGATWDKVLSRKFFFENKGN